MSYLIAVYDCAQKYGGPEEGGWWYDAGTLVRVVKVKRTPDAAEKYASRLNDKLRSRTIGPNAGKHDYTSVLSEGELRAVVCERIVPEGFPGRRPHYE